MVAFSAYGDRIQYMLFNRNRKRIQIVWKILVILVIVSMAATSLLAFF